MKIIISDGALYGQFEYYDKWNEDLSFFENVCTFYFYSEVINGDTILLNLGLPEMETTTGKIILHGNDSLTLYTGFSSGYAPVDFENEGYSAKLHKERSGIMALGVVKEKKCYFYNAPSDSSIRKSYIVKGNFVSIVQKKNEWSKVEYISPMSGKRFVSWIKSIALYDKNPKNW